MISRSAMFGALAALACTPLWATVFTLPADGSAVVGEDAHIQSQYKDTLLDIARRYSLGYEEIIRANPGTDMWIPGEGKDIFLPGRRILPPGPREGIVVNLPEHRIYYYPKPKKHEQPVVITFPVSIGKMDWRTPLGETHVITKVRHPNWYPPESVRKEHEANGDPLPKIVKAGPDNPLGDYAMHLAVGDGTYEIHGTNNPMAVGMAITHGCIRMYPEDVASLFPLVPVGTKVWLINEPVKTAYVDGQLYLEVHPPVDAQGQSTEPNMELLSQLLDKALGDSTAAINWDIARDELRAANGIPAVVGLEAVQDPQPAQAQTDSQGAATGSPQAAGGQAGVSSSNPGTGNAGASSSNTGSGNAGGDASNTASAPPAGPPVAPPTAATPAAASSETPTAAR